MNEEKLAAHLLEVIGDVLEIIGLAISEGDATTRSQDIREACATILSKAEASGVIESELTDEQRDAAISYFAAQILAGIEALV
ncbi:hypothetical protein D3C74_459210 [compost metagenome]